MVNPAIKEVKQNARDVPIINKKISLVNQLQQKMPLKKQNTLI